MSQAPTTADFDTPHSPFQTTKPHIAPSYRVWVTCLGIALLAIAILWYGVGALPRPSSDMARSPDQDLKGSEVAQRPPAQDDAQHHDRPQATAEPTVVAQAGNVTENVELVSAYLRKVALPESVRTAMLTVVRQHPSETRWSGRVGATLFGIAAKRMPKEQGPQRTVSAMLELTHMWSVHELLTAKSLLDRYAALELTDSITLRQAVVEAAGSLQISGKAGAVTHEASVEGTLAVAYAMADEAALAAQLLQPAEVEKVRIAYRDVMHRQALNSCNDPIGPTPSCFGSISIGANWYPNSFILMRPVASSNSTRHRTRFGF